MKFAILGLVMKNLTKKTCSSENFSFITFRIILGLNSEKFKALE